MNQTRIAGYLTNIYMHFVDGRHSMLVTRHAGWPTNLYPKQDISILHNEANGWRFLKRGCRRPQKGPTTTDVDFGGEGDCQGNSMAVTEDSTWSVNASSSGAVSPEVSVVQGSRAHRPPALKI